MLLAMICVHIFLCVVLVALILMQQGKGASVGASFGGSSNTVFGAAGAGNVLTKATTIVAILFMVTSIVLVKLYSSTSVSSLGVVSDPLKGSLLVSEETPPEPAKVSEGAGAVAGAAEKNKGAAESPVAPAAAVPQAVVPPSVAPAEPASKPAAK